MRIALLAVEGMFDSGLSVVLDVLAAANHLRADAAAGPVPFEVTVVGTEPSVRTGHGLRIATAPLSELDSTPDVLVTPAVGLKSPREVVDVVRHHTVLPVVVRMREAGCVLAAACSGTFFLAEAGVLDGLLATTSWWLGPAFRSRYAAVRLDESRTLTRDGDIITAGAAFAHIDLALSLVQQESPALADLVARYLVIGDRPSQAVFAVPSLLASNDPIITAFERWVRAHVADPLQISGAAAAIGVTNGRCSAPRRRCWGCRRSTSCTRSGWTRPRSCSARPTRRRTRSRRRSATATPARCAPWSAGDAARRSARCATLVPTGTCVRRNPTVRRGTRRRVPPHPGGSALSGRGTGW
jgi:transcriptional regulator GlxA family with amidase domain